MTDRIPEELDLEDQWRDYRAKLQQRGAEITDDDFIMLAWKLLHNTARPIAALRPLCEKMGLDPKFALQEFIASGIEEGPAAGESVEEPSRYMAVFTDDEGEVVISRVLAGPLAEAVGRAEAGIIFGDDMGRGEYGEAEDDQETVAGLRLQCVLFGHPIVWYRPRNEDEAIRQARETALAAARNGDEAMRYAIGCRTHDDLMDLDPED